jgi:hypothetical protein
MDRKRKLIYFKNYYWDFYNAQKEKVKDKIDYRLRRKRLREQQE